MATLRPAFMSALVLELCAMLGTAVAAATIGIALCAGDLSLRAGLTILILAPELYGPLREVGRQFHASADATAAAERIFGAIDAVPEPQRPRPAVAAAVPDPSIDPIRLRHVGFTYPGTAEPVLEDVQLTIEPGKITALIGPSGTGKSTLAQLVRGFAAPSAGTISCGQRPIAEREREAWWARIAWLSQDATLFAATIADNVAMGAPLTDDAIVAALRDAGASSFVARLSGGIGTIIGEGGRRLSAGQARQIALARAIARDAPLLILDEPTSRSRRGLRDRRPAGPRGARSDGAADHPRP
jgi:ABC-type transport system involved in cytochrome bd biosynthesis fused ATPase/permease subunit